MYRNSYKKGLLTIFYSAGINPLRNWNVCRKNGYMKRIYEKDNGMLIMEMRGLNATVHFISCPKLPCRNLGIGMPIINLLIRNLNACFSFEIQVMDTTGKSRRFRCANYLRRSTINLFETTIPLAICCDWVLIYFNLAEFTRRCYCTDYFETNRIQVNGNVHIRRIFFSDRVIEYSKLPKDYQLSTLIDTAPRAQPPRARPSSPASCTELLRNTCYRPDGPRRTSSISELEVTTECLDNAYQEEFQAERSEKSEVSVDAKGLGVVTTFEETKEEFRATTTIMNVADILGPGMTAEDIKRLRNQICRDQANEIRARSTVIGTGEVPEGEEENELQAKISIDENDDEFRARSTIIVGEDNTLHKLTPETLNQLRAKLCGADDADEAGKSCTELTEQQSQLLATQNYDNGEAEMHATYAADNEDDDSKRKTNTERPSQSKAKPCIKSNAEEIRVKSTVVCKDETYRMSPEKSAFLTECLESYAKETRAKCIEKRRECHDRKKDQILPKSTDETFNRMSPEQLSQLLAQHCVDISADEIRAKSTTITGDRRMTYDELRRFQTKRCIERIAEKTRKSIDEPEICKRRMIAEKQKQQKFQKTRASVRSCEEETRQRCSVVSRTEDETNRMTIEEQDWIAARATVENNAKDVRVKSTFINASPKCKPRPTAQELRQLRAEILQKCKAKKDKLVRYKCWY